MLVYVGFALALTAANIRSHPEPTPAFVSPQTIPAEIMVERSFFKPTVTQRRRNDI
jgi:hypothetical protein